MTQFASDGFTGTDGTELSAYDSAWSKVTGVTGGLQLVSGRVRPTNTTSASYTHSAAPPSADYSVSADITLITSTGNAFGVTARSSPTANTCYHLRYYDSGTALQLYKFVSGTATLIGSVGVLLETTKNLKLDVVGSTLKGYWDGSATPSITVTDSSITAANKAGIRDYAPTMPSDTVGLQLDNFSADYAGGGAGVTLTAPLLASTATLYAPALSAGSVAITAPAIASASQVFAPSLAIGPVTLSAPRIESTATLYPPQISVGPVTLTAPLIASTAQVFAPAVSAAQVISAPTLASTLQLFAPELNWGAVQLGLPLLPSGNAFYVHQITGGVPGLAAGVAFAPSPSEIIFTPGSAIIFAPSPSEIIFGETS